VLAPLYLLPLITPSHPLTLESALPPQAVSCRFVNPALKRLKGLCQLHNNNLIFKVGPTQHSAILKYFKSKQPADVFQLPPLELEVYTAGHLYGKTTLRFFLTNHKPIVLGSYLVMAPKDPYCVVIAYDPQHLYLSAQLSDYQGHTKSYSIFSAPQKPFPVTIAQAQPPSHWDIFWLPTRSTRCKTTVSNGMTLAITAATPLTEEQFSKQLVELKKQKSTFVDPVF